MFSKFSCEGATSLRHVTQYSDMIDKVITISPDNDGAFCNSVEL